MGACASSEATQTHAISSDQKATYKSQQQPAQTGPSSVRVEDVKLDDRAQGKPFDPKLRSKAQDANPDYPVQGVHVRMLEQLQQWLVKQGQRDASTAEVCEMIKQRTLSEKLSYLDHVEASQSDPLHAGCRPQDIAPMANLFVSHGRKGRFRDLVESVRAFVDSAEGKKLGGEDNIRAWVDILVLNQHDTTVKDTKFFTTIFTDCIKNIGHTLIVLSPWKESVHLSRIWCLFEFLATLTTKTSYSLGLSKSDAESFRKELMTDPGRILAILGKVKTEKAEAFHAADKKFIGDAIRQQIRGGFNELDESITQLLRIWLRSQAVAVITHGDVDEKESEATADALKNVGRLFSDMGFLDEAADMSEKALAMYIKTLGEEHHSVATTFVNLAVVLQAQGKLEEAAEMFKKGLALLIKTLGEEHHSVATTYNYLALVLRDQGKLEEAVEMFKKSLAMKIKTLGEEHHSVATTFGGLAGVLRAQGKLEEAAEMFKKALALYIKTLGEEHHSVAMTLDNLAQVLRAQVKLEEAAEMFKKALAIKIKTLGEEHHSVATTFGNLGLVLQDQGKLEEAAEMQRKSLDLKIKTLGEEHHSVATTYNNLALVLKDQGKLEEAAELYKKDLAISIKTLGEEHHSVATSLVNLSQVHIKQREFDEAVRLCRRGLEIFRITFTEEHWYVGVILTWLGLALAGQGEFKQGEEMLKIAENNLTAALGVEHPRVAQVYHNQGELSLLNNDTKTAAMQFRAALQLREKCLGKDHPKTRETRRLLERCDVAQEAAL